MLHTIVVGLVAIALLAVSSLRTHSPTVTMVSVLALAAGMILLATREYTGILLGAAV